MEDKQENLEEPLRPERNSSSVSDEAKEGSKTDAAPWKRRAMFLIALNLLFLFVLLIIAIVWSIEHGQPNSVNKDHVYCIDCSKVNKTGEYEVKEGSSKQCCGSADRIVKDIVYRKIKKNFAEDESNDPFMYSRLSCGEDKSTKRPATRLVGLYHPTESNSNELKWGKNDKLTFDSLLANIEHKGGRLVPKIRGTYYLYSQITVNLNRTSTSQISHTVYRWRSRDQNMEQLLEGAISNCQLSVNSSDSTSYVGATFMLDANDEIEVKITHPEIVKYHSDAGNYFDGFSITHGLIANKIDQYISCMTLLQLGVLISFHFTYWKYKISSLFNNLDLFCK